MYSFSLPRKAESGAKQRAESSVDWKISIGLWCTAKAIEFLSTS